MFLASETYETDNIRLAALILTEIPGSLFKVYPQKDSPRKLIKITFLPGQKKAVDALIHDFTRREAKSNIFFYNKQLNWLRDVINGKISC